MSYGKEVTMKLSTLEKYEEVMHFKQYFRLRSERASNPAEYVVTLPPQPSEFMKTYPSLASAYDGHPPVACPLDADMLIALADSFPLRKPRSGTCDWASNSSQALVPATSRPRRSENNGQGAVMQLMQMNSQLMRKIEMASALAMLQI